MVFLVFLYWLAAMFLFGGEINGVIIAAKKRRLHKIKDAQLENVVAAP